MVGFELFFETFSCICSLLCGVHIEWNFDFITKFCTSEFHRDFSHCIETHTSIMQSRELKFSETKSSYNFNSECPPNKRVDHCISHPTLRREREAIRYFLLIRHSTFSRKDYENLEQHIRKQP